MNETTKDTFHVLIIGAGLGGLALAQLLRKARIRFDIFEKQEAANSRFEGWSLALGPVADDLTQGLPADIPHIALASHLHPLNVLPEFCMFDPTGRLIRRIEGGEKGLTVTRLNRKRLRDVLATNIDVQWDKELTHMEEYDSKVRLHFTKGEPIVGDFVVGADGAHSKVRSHLFPGKQLLRQTPTSVISGEVLLKREQYQKQFEIARSGYLVCGLGGLRLFVGLSEFEGSEAQVARYYWILSSLNSASEDAQYRTLSKQDVYDRALSATRDLEPRLTDILHLTGPDGIRSPGLRFEDVMLPDLPSGRPLTLLGDAAHAMVPNRGQGANHALTDAIKLAEALSGFAANKETLFTNIDIYQEEMLRRGREGVQRSWAASLDTGEETLNGWQKNAERRAE